MKLRNFYFELFVALILASLLFYGCKDYNDLDLESNSGNADFSQVVAVGNSLTAGYQSDALFRTAQKYSFPNLVSGQMEAEQQFNQPLISNPGISLRNGRLELDGTADLTDPTNTPTPTDQSGSLLEDQVFPPYNNLGVPGALLADFLGEDLPGQPYSERRQNNPFFDLVLDEADTQLEQLSAMDPSFVMFWLGNNEVLGYVTSGGDTPYVPSNSFQQLYGGSMQALAQTGADVILFNIPNVTSIPYVFLVNNILLDNDTITINEQNNTFALVTPQGDIPIWIEQTDPGNPGSVQDTVMMTAPDTQQPGGFFLLHAQAELAELFGSGVGTTQNNPIPHNLVLDNGEAMQAIQLVNQYNQVINSSGNSNSYPIVDINTSFSDIVESGGITEDGVTLTPTPGSLFSLDGVHPSNRGHGIVANMAIDAINNSYDANLPSIDISEIPQGIPVSN